MINKLEKIIGIYNPKSRSAPREKGAVKTQLEIVEVEKAHSILIYEVCIVH